MAVVINGTTGIDKVQDGSIGTAKIAANAITSAKVVDNAITSAKVVDGAITNADINAGAAIVGSKLGASAGLLLAEGPINAGNQTTTSGGPHDVTVCTFTMPANKTLVIIQGSWSYYCYQSNNGWTLCKFEFTTNTGTLSLQSNQWQGTHVSGADNDHDMHGYQGGEVKLSGVSAGTSVTIGLRMTFYNSSVGWGYYNHSHATAIAY